MDKAKKSSTPIDYFLKKIINQLIKVAFKKKDPLILVNGVAEQYESWFFNVSSLTENFVVHWPNLYLFQSNLYLADLKKISVSWIVNRLETYLDSFVTTPPYHLVGSSAGCQTIATLAAKRPEIVSKLVLICPSGLEGDEHFPVIEGVSKRDLRSMISSIFHNKENFAVDEIIDVLKERFENKKWRLGFVKMAQVTKKNSIIEELLSLKCPVLFICGEEDQIIPIWQAYNAVQKMRDVGVNVAMIVIRECGHAPQIERFQITNRFVTEFLNGKLLGEKTKERFWKQDGISFMPFELDKAVSKANAAREKAKHIVESPALV